MKRFAVVAVMAAMVMCMVMTGCAKKNHPFKERVFLTDVRQVSGLLGSYSIRWTSSNELFHFHPQDFRLFQGMRANNRAMRQMPV